LCCANNDGLTAVIRERLSGFVGGVCNNVSGIG
jgi:hypothetical protein